MSKPLTTAIQALIQAANAVTGAQDATLTDAIETLLAGFSTLKKVTGSFTGNNTYTQSLAIDKAPDIIFIKRHDYASPTAINQRCTAMFVWINNFLGVSFYSTAGSTSWASVSASANSGRGSTSSPTAHQTSYTGGNLYMRAGNNSNVWSNQLTYDYTFIYL